MKKQSGWSSGIKKRIIKTTLDDIATKHSQAIASRYGRERPPLVHIEHEQHDDHADDKYHVSVTWRDRDGSPTMRQPKVTHSEGEFLRMSLGLHKDDPKMNPWPKEARIRTHNNGWVDLKIGHPDYKKKNP